MIAGLQRPDSGVAPMSPQVQSSCQRIADILVPALPEAFHRAWVYAELTDDTRTATAYVSSGPGHAAMLDDLMLDADLADAMDMLREAWADSGQPAFSVAVFQLDGSGHFDLDVSQHDVSDAGQTLRRRSAWEKTVFGRQPITP